MRIRNPFVARLLAGLVLLAPVVPASAAAKDLCVYDNGNTLLYVFRNYKVPGVNKCGAVLGSSAANGILTGAACRSADGDVIRLGFTIYESSGIFSPAVTKTVQMAMHYPDDGNGGTEWEQLSSDKTTVSYSFKYPIHTEACTGPALY